MEKERATNRISKLRNYYGLSQVKLAKLSGIATSTLRYIEQHSEWKTRLNTYVKIINGFRKSNENLKYIEIDFLFEK